MIDQLSAVNDRIDRADEHLDALKGELVSYYTSDPCQMTGEYEPDADGNGWVNDLTVTIAPIKDRLNTTLGEFLHDLRSSLDHLAWQLVLQSKGNPTKHTTFPICETRPSPKEDGSTCPPVIGGISEPAQPLVGGVQPYQLGDKYAEHPLWVLHRLWNIDKHRHVVARGGHTRAKFVGRTVPPFRFTAQFDPASVSPLGAKLMLAPDEPEMDVDAHLTFEVAIEEPEERIKAPLLLTLERLHQAVNGVVNTAEATCF